MGHPALWDRARRGLDVGRYLLRGSHEADFRYFRRFAGCDGLFLDVGANAGMSALSYRVMDRSSRILSLEPNPYHEPALRRVQRLLGDDFEFRLHGAGEFKERLALHVPFYRAVPLTGDASVHLAEAQRSWTLRELGIGDPSTHPDVSFRSVEILVRPVDDLELRPHAVKIDVQGAELAVLRGMRRTLERERPILLVEDSPETPAIAQELHPIGYRGSRYEVRTDELVPIDGTPTVNVFFTPT
jgi:FkbM family methyltransferase